jgi:hypothetical protein
MIPEEWRCSTHSSLKTEIRNNIGTQPGERRMSSTFGSPGCGIGGSPGIGIGIGSSGRSGNGFVGGGPGLGVGGSGNTMSPCHFEYVLMFPFLPGTKPAPDDGPLLSATVADRNGLSAGERG